LVALRLADDARLKDSLTAQKQVVLAIDGLQPGALWAKDQDVLWVLRDCLSGAVLLARSRVPSGCSAREADLADLLREVKRLLPVPIHAVVSDGQRTIRLAVQNVGPDVPHQLCHYHSLKEAGAPWAKPIVEADHHAKSELKKYVRGVREIERSVAKREDAHAAAIRGYCVAVRSALTDAGHPPLQLPGLALHDRLTAIQRSLDRVQEKRGCRPSWSSSRRPWRLVCLPPSVSGHRSRPPIPGSTERRACWRTRPARMRQRWNRSTAACWKRY
jgi:hypothetical protein